MGKYNKDYFLNNKRMIIKVIAVIAIAAAAFFVFADDRGEDEGFLAEDGEQLAVEDTEKEKKEEKEPATIVVDVGGAVNNPIVAELPSDSRIGDAIEAAGGLTEDADISNINRAAFVNDGDKVYVPAKGEELSGAGSETDENYSISGGSTSLAGKVNINSASSEELQTLNGVGPATAAKIIDYRTNTGRFTRIEDIINVSGIGEKTFEKLKDHITI